MFDSELFHVTNPSEDKECDMASELEFKLLFQDFIRNLTNIWGYEYKTHRSRFHTKFVDTNSCLKLQCVTL
jgi:hypothetical protein